MLIRDEDANCRRDKRKSCEAMRAQERCRVAIFVAVYACRRQCSELDGGVVDKTRGESCGVKVTCRIQRSRTGIGIGRFRF